MNKLLIICGPTATGKTKLALSLASVFNGELISADSRQIYKGMDIGTGKDLPNTAQQSTSINQQLLINFKNKEYKLFPYIINNIPVWMYDVVYPSEEFSVAHYQFLSTAVIKNILQRNKLPIVVGGTGLYIHSLIHPLSTLEIPPNPALRNDLEKQTLSNLQKVMRGKYIHIWENLNNSEQSNKRRLIRKIEIEEFQKNNQSQSHLESSYPSYNSLLIGLTTDNHILYEHIDQRVEERVSMGIEKEIKLLLSNGYGFDLPAMNSLGYKEWESWINEKNHTQKVKNNIIQTWKYDEHQYARRQITWFNREKDIQWFNITDEEISSKIEDTVRSWYTKGVLI